MHHSFYKGWQPPQNAVNPMVTAKPRSIGTLIAWIAVVAVAYVLSARLGFSLEFSNVKQVTAVWPPACNRSRRLRSRWLAHLASVFIGAFVANYFLVPGTPLYTAGAVPSGTPSDL